METLTTPQALLYIGEAIGRKVHQPELPRWRRIGWVERYTAGYDGKSNTYTVDALDALCEKINTRYRQKRNG